MVSSSFHLLPSLRHASHGTSADETISIATARIAKEGEKCSYFHSAQTPYSCLFVKTEHLPAAATPFDQRRGVGLQKRKLGERKQDQTQTSAAVCKEETTFFRRRKRRISSDTRWKVEREERSIKYS